MMAALMGQRNAEDSSRKSEAVKAGMKRRREAGKHHGGPRPYGYRYRDGNLAPRLKAEAAVVRRIFAEYVGRRLAAFDLAQASHAGRRRRPCAAASGTKGTVRMILANPLYAGMLRVGEDLLVAAHAPIIEKKVWRQVEALRAARTRTYGGGRPPAGSHLFRKGMLRCGECGEAMVPRTSPQSRQRLQRGLSLLRTPPRQGLLLDAAPYPVLGSTPPSTATSSRWASMWRPRAKRSLRPATERLLRSGRYASRPTARSRELRAEAKRAQRDYRSGDLSGKRFEPLMAEIEADLEAAEAEAERLIASEQDAAAGSDQVDAEAETLRRLSEIRKAIAGEINDAASTDAVRAALSRLFEGFVVHRGLPERAHVELIGDVWIEPVIRHQALEQDGEAIVPRFREPLQQAENNYAVTLTR